MNAQSEHSSASGDDRTSRPTHTVSRHVAGALDASAGVVVVVSTGPDEGRRIHLPVGRHVVGSASSADVRLEDSSVSRRHLTIDVGPRGIEVEDMASKNGTSVNGQRVARVAVAPGAWVGAGRVVLRVELARPADLAEPPARFGALHGRSEAMRDVFRQLARLAETQLPVLISGETGTGKDLAARSLHAASAVADGPFVVCDLAGLSATLMESELFGHVRGAFTGATEDRTGLFASADGGTIFLDEIGELPLEAQSRLLRVLETGQVRQVGGNRYRPARARIIAATNRDLHGEVAAGRFRADLFFRLSAARVRMPPLRERREDIPLLCDAFVAALRTQSPELVPLPPALLDELTTMDWPGNARQLRNAVERVCRLGSLSQPPAGGGVALPPPLREAKNAWERTYLTTLLDATGGNISAAARRAGIARGHFYRLLDKHQLRGPATGTVLPK